MFFHEELSERYHRENCGTNHHTYLYKDEKLEARIETLQVLIISLFLISPILLMCNYILDLVFNPFCTFSQRLEMPILNSFLLWVISFGFFGLFFKSISLCRLPFFLLLGIIFCSP